MNQSDSSKIHRTCYDRLSNSKTTMGCQVKSQMAKDAEINSTIKAAAAKINPTRNCLRESGESIYPAQGLPWRKSQRGSVSS